MDDAEPAVVAVSSSPRHRFSKQPAEVVTLVEGYGVLGDSHGGSTVQHRSRKRRRPGAPNLRQVHLLHAELTDALGLSPGDVGENVLVRGLDLLALPTGARLRLGPDAVVRVTGLRNPCVQLDRFRDGLMAAMLATAADGSVRRLAGVMSVVEAGGHVRPGDGVLVELPDGEHVPLGPV